MKRLAAMIALILPLASNAGYDEGIDAYGSGDYARALVEFKALADHGDMLGQYFLGMFYHNGFGVPRDQAEAIKWFRKSAQQGDARSQYYVGIMSASGQGVAKDPVAAHAWLTLSATNPRTTHRDSLYTKEEIAKVEKKLTPEQIAQSKEMVKNWKPEN